MVSEECKGLASSSLSGHQQLNEGSAMRSATPYDGGLHESWTLTSDLAQSMSRICRVGHSPLPRVSELYVSLNKRVPKRFVDQGSYNVLLVGAQGTMKH